MSKECNDGSCETETSKCGESSGCGCPVEEAAEMWQGAFCCALRSVMVDQLKARIEKQWGEAMAKEADGLVTAMGAKWGAKISAMQAHMAMEEFKNSMAKTWIASASQK